ncbi:Protein of unknown function [Pyronema omphalodes CBS 100304]|uniref:Uncharacterized protein n=1 Tax=Pyronema omphalodes (strain CBS 100304) TaxID=1076935 RepID=U4LLQ0_PYROM|nr:Protein of unknown function [Pyronema omphalodes CBS 100304]
MRNQDKLIQHLYDVYLLRLSRFSSSDDEDENDDDDGEEDDDDKDDDDEDDNDDDNNDDEDDDDDVASSPQAMFLLFLFLPLPLLLLLLLLLLNPPGLSRSTSKQQNVSTQILYNRLHGDEIDVSKFNSSFSGRVGLEDEDHGVSSEYIKNSDN